MCRAVWVLIAGPSAEVNRALRRAAGADAQVVAMAQSDTEAFDALSSSNADVVVVSKDLENGQSLVSRIRESAPEAAVVWVGSDAPEGAHASIDEVSDALEGAITRGLLAARAAR
jgi:methylmalonyl-CoA mutase cobalamin-binding subunit